MEPAADAARPIGAPAFAATHPVLHQHGADIVEIMATTVNRRAIVSGRATPARAGAAAVSGRPVARTRPAQALALLLLALAGWLSVGTPVRAGEPAAPAIVLDVSEIVEYWYWAGGVEVSGSGFAAAAAVDLVATDPEGGIRRFAATTDAGGAFSFRINALRLRSVLGEHVVSATDGEGNVATAPLAVIRDPNEVVVVKTEPVQLPIAQFAASGVEVRIQDLAPGGRVRINLGDPAENTGELMNDRQLFADADGVFEFVLDPDTQISGAGVGAVVPTEGLWSLSVSDFSGNDHRGSAEFRMLPDNPSTEHYCAVSMNAAEPITRVGFAGIDNPSAADAADGYEDFTGLTGQVTIGQTHTIRLQGRARWSFNANTYTVFIDWNRNGILDEAQEIYWVGALVGSTGQDGMEVVYDIAVPEDAVPGPTRMRVLKVYSPSTFAMFWPDGACGRYRNGQVEDYTLLVGRSEAIFADGFEEASNAVAPTVAKAFSPSTVATSTPTALTITLTNATAAAATLTADLVDAFPDGLVSAANASTTCTGGPGLAQTGTSVTLRAGAVIPAAGSCAISVQVAALAVGDLTNTIPAGGLVTDAGSHAEAATATLTVVAP